MVKWRSAGLHENLSHENKAAIFSRVWWFEIGSHFVPLANLELTAQKTFGLELALILLASVSQVLE